MDMFQRKKAENDMSKKNMLSNRNLDMEIKMLKASTDTVIGDISFQQRQLRKKYSPDMMRKRLGFKSPVLQRKDISKHMESSNHHQRPKSCITVLSKRRESESVQGIERCYSARERIHTITRSEQEVTFSPLTQSPSSYVSGNKKRLSQTTGQRSTHSKVTSSQAVDINSVVVPSIVVDDTTESPTPEVNFLDENSLNLPIVRPRCNSMPSVFDKNQSKSSGASKLRFADLSELKKAERSSSITNLNHSGPQWMSRSKSDSLLPPRRKSINISVDRLIRDLWHGIQHQELGVDSTNTWTLKKQREWNELRSCKYLRFPKDASSDDSGSEDNTAY